MIGLGERLAASGLVDELPGSLLASTLHPPHNAVPIEVQVGVAALAGAFASVALMVAVQRQSYGDVIPLLILALFSGTDLLDVSQRLVYATTVVLGVVMGILAKLVGIATFGTNPVDPLQISVLTLQELTGGVAVVVLAYVLGAYVLLPKFEDDVASPARIRRHWLVACLVYLASLLVCVPLASYLVPGA